MALDLVDVELEIEALQLQDDVLPAASGFRIARVIGSGMPVHGPRVVGMVLAPADEGAGSSSRVPASRCFELPRDLPLDRAVIVPSLAYALWIWDACGLEIGDVAVYTSGSAVDRLIARIAAWRCGGRIIRLDTGDAEWDSAAEVTILEVPDPQEAVEKLAQALRSAPGVAAAVMTGDAAVMDVILEAIPMWGRVVLASRTTDAATVDFYNNVHRKGCRIVSVPGSPDDIFDAHWIQFAASHIVRAVRILQNDALAARCMT